MKNLSIWGQKHPWIAQLSLVALHTYLFSLAAATGIWLYAKTITIPYDWITFSIGIFLLAFFFYPIRGSKDALFKHSYWRQKCLDLALVCTSMVIVAGVSNQWTRTDQKLLSNTYSVQNIVHKVHPKTLRKEKRRAKRAYRKKLLKEIRATVKQIKKQKTSTAQTALIILTIIAGLYALLFVTALSCSVSCSGNQGGAMLLLFSGVGLVIFLAILAIKAILRMERKR